LAFSRILTHVRSRFFTLFHWSIIGQNTSWSEREAVSGTINESRERPHDTLTAPGTKKRHSESHASDRLSVIARFESRSLSANSAVKRETARTTK
jgi:hypothetical protein